MAYALSDFLDVLGGIAAFIEGASNRVDKNPLVNPPTDGDWIVVSEDKHVIVIYHDGTKLKTINDFSTGGEFKGVMHHTPTGQFTVISKDEHHTSSKYKDKSGNAAPMPLYVQFAPSVGFHVGDPNAVSHGCIHLTRADAKFLFDMAREGKTHVWVLNRGPKKRGAQDVE
jgi:lipoprotein-anchoring transpeptidase ErfK/SrfK